MAEMRDMVLATGGVAVQTDTFHNVVFKVRVGSYIHVFKVLAIAG
jgi:hypothetical protein